MTDLDLCTRDKLRAWVDQTMRANFGDPGQNPATTVFGVCLTRLGEAALATGNFDQDLISSSVFDQISDFVWDMSMAVTEYDKPVDVNFWRHQRNPVHDVRHDQAPEILRVEIEAITDRYLNMSVKAAHIDRLLLDMLAGCEVIAYAKVVYGKVSEYEEALVHPVRFVDFLKSRAKISALWVGVYAVASILGWEWAQTAIIWLGVIETMIGIALFPIGYKMITKRNERALKPLRAMIGVYSGLDSTGSISARHILDQATRACEAGVTWPAPLFALLDDILARGGRL